MTSPARHPSPEHAPTSLPDAVLWDLDGTLVNTEPYWMAAETELVTRHGGRWSHEKGLLMVGQDLRTSAEIIRDVGGVALAPERIIAWLVASVTERVRDEVPWRPGARELVADLRRHDVPTALVTMSFRSLAETIVAALPAGSFRCLVAGDEVEHGKPDPEPYLHGLGKLGTEASRSVAIEDSPAGVASATAAGLTTVTVPLFLPVEPGPRRVLRETLDGVGATDLGALVG